MEIYTCGICGYRSCVISKVVTSALKKELPETVTLFLCTNHQF